MSTSKLHSQVLPVFVSYDDCSLLRQDTRLTKRNGPQTLEMIADIAAKEKEKLEQAAAIVMGAKCHEPAAPQEAKAPQSKIFGSGALAECHLCVSEHTSRFKSVLASSQLACGEQLSKWQEKTEYPMKLVMPGWKRQCLLSPFVEWTKCQFAVSKVIVRLCLCLVNLIGQQVRNQRPRQKQEEDTSPKHPQHQCRSQTPRQQAAVAWKCSQLLTLQLHGLLERKVLWTTWTSWPFNGDDHRRSNWLGCPAVACKSMRSDRM